MVVRLRSSSKQASAEIFCRWVDEQVIKSGEKVDKDLRNEGSIIFMPSALPVHRQFYRCALYCTFVSFMRKPISFLDCSGGLRICRIASKTIWNCASYLLSNSASFRTRSLCVANTSRNFTNDLIIAIFTCTARGLPKTPESIAIPCSVKAKGRYLECSPLFKVPSWYLKAVYSCCVSSKRKSAGKRCFPNTLLAKMVASYQPRIKRYTRRGVSPSKQDGG